MDLNKIRLEIDRIDSEILRLFKERMEQVKLVAEYKIKTNAAVLDSAREAEKIQRIRSLCQSEEFADRAEFLFKDIMSISRKMQHELLKGGEDIAGFLVLDSLCLPSAEKNIVHFGERGAFSEQAAINFFGENTNTISTNTFSETIELLESDRAEYAVLPIENTYTGGIADIYDILAKKNVYILAEVVLGISQHLIGLKGTRLEDVKNVYSHPQALSQCKKFFGEHSWLKQNVFSSTSAAISMVAKENRKEFAAIGSKRAAELYGLEIIEKNINTAENNKTRFIVIGREKSYVKGADKVSICVELENSPGSLYNMLENFYYNKLNLTHIESRPIENREFEYRFFIDFEGNPESKNTVYALESLIREFGKVKIIGIYKKFDG